MSDLRMTSGRLNLLRAVRDGLVWYYPAGTWFGLRQPAQRTRTVTARAHELRIADLVEVDRPGASLFEARAVRLTAAGEAILAPEDQEASR